MLRPDGHAVVIDLGVARHTSQTTLTAQGHSLGTVGYLAPEQARAVKALSCKCDIFALGLTAQQALLGRHPTNGNQHALTNGLGGTAALVAGLPQDFTDAIDSTLHAHPHRRPHPRALMSDMQQFLRPGGNRP
jgi:serine/threonine protein kinase